MIWGRSCGEWAPDRIGKGDLPPILEELFLGRIRYRKISMLLLDSCLIRDDALDVGHEQTLRTSYR